MPWGFVVSVPARVHPAGRNAVVAAPQAIKDLCVAAAGSPASIAGVTKYLYFTMA
jgi:hypothetical protein